MMLNLISKCSSRAILTIKLHIPLVIAISVFYIFSCIERYTYATPYEYSVITGDKIIDNLVQETVPFLSQYEMKPKCSYDKIVFRNRFMYVDSDLNEFDPSGIREGGEYMPTNCRPKFSTAILIPYRDRKEQMNAFIIHIHNFLRQQNIHYRIFVVEQADDKPFNRAKLFNIGAKFAMEEQFPCLVFHDVDLFPMNVGNLYACMKQPRHMTVNIDKFRFHLLYTNNFGGSVAMQSKTFQELNGMSNAYFGWGGEDDDFLERIRHIQIGFDRFGSNFADYSMIKHKQVEKNENRHELLKNAATRFKTDGLNSLEFKEKYFKLLPLYTLISAEL